MANNGSWTGQRAQDNPANSQEQKDANQQSQTDDSSGNNAPSSETVYPPPPVAPSDLDNREVKPVAPQRERPAYF